jgi:hypothetical protein
VEGRTIVPSVSSSPTIERTVAMRASRSAPSLAERLNFGIRLVSSLGVVDMHQPDITEMVDGILSREHPDFCQHLMLQ